MKATILSVLLFLVTPTCLAGHDWKEVGPPITAAVDVDAHGAVTHAQLLGKDALPALQTLVEQTTRNWRFIPARVDGKAASSRTYVLFDVEIRKADGNEQARLHYLLHGPGRVLIETPAYPASMLRERVEAMVWVAFNVNGDGSVSNVHITKAQTSRGAKGAAFYEPLRSATRMDTFLPELVNGRPVVTHMVMPVGFGLADGGPGGELSPAQDTPHDGAHTSSDDVTTFANVPFALDSPLRLVTSQP